MKKPTTSTTAAHLTRLRAWMLKNGVVSATVDGISLTLHPSAFSTKPEGELTQPKGLEVELPEDLQDLSPEDMAFYSSQAGPPPGLKKKEGT